MYNITSNFNYINIIQRKIYEQNSYIISNNIDTNENIEIYIDSKKLLEFNIDIDNTNILIDDKIIIKNSIVKTNHEKITLKITNNTFKLSIYNIKIIENNDVLLINDVIDYNYKLDKFNKKFYKYKKITEFNKKEEFEYLLYISSRKILVKNENNNDKIAIMNCCNIKPELEFIIKNNINILDDFNHLILCNSKCFNYVKKIIDYNNLKNVIVEKNDDVNIICKTTFWNKITENKIFFYNNNCLIKKNISKYFNLNYLEIKEENIILTDKISYYDRLNGKKYLNNNENDEFKNDCGIINYNVSLLNNYKEIQLSYYNNKLLKNKKFDVILIKGEDIYYEYDVYNCNNYDFNKLKLSINKNYLIINGNFNDLTLDKIEQLYEHFEKSNSNILSPHVLYNNENEYFGGLNRIINENIISYHTLTNGNIPVFNYIHNTIIPYPKLFFIKNIDLILSELKKIKNDDEFYEFINGINIKNVRIDPFIKINALEKLPIIEKNVKYLFKLDNEYLSELYRMYYNIGLMSFKFDKNYYFNNNSNKYILIIEETILTPDKDGGSLYIYYMIKTLIKMNYNIHFATRNFYYDSKYTKQIQELGVYVIYNYPYSLETILLQNYNVYDYIFICRLSCMEQIYDECRNMCKRAKIIFITHDLGYLRDQRQNNGVLNESLKKKELEYIKKADVSVVVSKYEKKILEKEKIKVYYAPICYELKENYVRLVKNTKDIYFIGSNHLPNRVGVKYFLDNVWKDINNVLNIKFHVIGNGFDEIKHNYDKNVIFHGYLKDDDMEKIILNCRYHLCCLTFGAGFKTKNLLAFGNKIPCITTSIGAEGIEIEHEKNSIILDFDDKNYVNKFINYYNNIELAEKIAENGYLTYKKYYSINSNVEYLKKLLHKN